MCGIIGVSMTPGVHPDRADELARCGVERLRHRGPDGRGICGDDVSAVGMARLRVRSRPEDTVPFTDGGNAYAFNGEIYSAEGLVPPGGLGEATAAGRLRADRLDGMYALVRRAPDATLHVRRDPFGIKPLYLLQDPHVVAVASECSALLGAFGPRPVRQDAIAQFLLFGRVVDGGSFFCGVRPVRPGECLELRAGRVHWAGGFSKSVQGEGTEHGDLRAAVGRSVDRVLLSDRPLGLAVSGGLDSTVIASELAVRGVTDVATVSVLPEGTEDGVEGLGELDLPGNAWRTWRHHTTSFGPQDFLDGIDAAVAALHEPTALTSVPMYAALARTAREAGIVVLLVGEGADELFGGYRSYLGLTDMGASAEAFFTSAGRVAVVRDLLGANAVAKALEALREALPTCSDTTEIVRRFEREHSLEPLLRRADHLLMAEGIEGRTPFLHGDLASLADALPWHELVRDGQTKVALRRAYADRLPQFATEIKKPFRAPVARWLVGAAAGRLAQELAGYRSRLAEVGVRPEGVNTVINALAAGRPKAAEIAFALRTLGVWLDHLSRAPGK